MSEALNTIHAYFGAQNTTTTAPVKQWAYGQKLIIHDPNLPNVFEAYYSNSKSRGDAKPQIGQDGEVRAPKEYFESGADIYVFLMQHEGEEDGRYNKVVHIPITPAPRPTDIDPDPEESLVIGELVDAMNSAVAQCEAFVEHYPTVINGEWYVWDEAQQTFVTTGIPATGNGIAEARLNQDYTLTLVFTDGSSFTTPISIRGEKGDTGAVPNFTVGTVTTLPAGSSASASITGTQEQPVLNLSIPQGQDGAITNLDTTLTVSGKAADAKVVGDGLENVRDQINLGYTKLAEAQSIDITDYAGSHIDKAETTVASPTVGASVNLFCCGKNHLKLTESGTKYTISYTVRDDGGIELNGTADRNMNVNPWTIAGVYNTKWRFSIQRSAENSGVHLRFNGINQEDSFEWGPHTTAYYNQPSIYIDKNAVCDHLIIYPMVEFLPYSETVSFEKFYGFIKSHTLVEGETTISWGALDIDENAINLWTINTADVTAIFISEKINDAVRALGTSVSELSGVIDDAYAYKWVVDIDGWSDADVTYTTGGYINSSGDVTSNGSFRYSNYIPCLSGNKIDYNLYGYSSSVYIVTFYNSAKTRISGIVGQSSYKSGSVVAPDNTAFVRFSTSNSNEGTFTKSIKTRVTGDELKAELEEYTDNKTSVSETSITITRADIPVIEGSIYSNIGIYALAGGRRTDYIPVSEGDIIKYRCYTYIGSSVKCNTITTFNSNKEIVGSVVAEETGYISGTYTIPSGVAYVMISWLWAMQRDGWFSIEVATYNQSLADIIKLNKVIPYSPLNGKQWCCLGDSITYGANTTKTYFNFIEDRCAVTPYNFGKSNTAIAKKTDATTDAMVTRYTEMFDDADYVTVFGGTNDHGQSITIGEWGDEVPTTLYGAMKILVEGLINKYPGKKIGFILPLPKCTTTSGGVTTDYSYPSASFYPYIQCIEDVCKRYSIPTLDLYTASGLSPSMADIRTGFIPDGLHPNADGHELISRKIQSFLESL